MDQARFLGELELEELPPCGFWWLWVEWEVLLVELVELLWPPTPPAILANCSGESSFFGSLILLCFSLFEFSLVKTNTNVSPVLTDL